jgi:hypothetical protein
MTSLIFSAKCKNIDYLLKPRFLLQNLGSNHINLRYIHRGGYVELLN